MKRILNRAVVAVAVLSLGMATLTTDGAAQQKEKSSSSKKEQSSSSKKDQSGSSQKGWLGVAIQDVTAQAEKKMEMKSRDGALVSEVERDSPAESAGLKEGDVIVQFGGTSIANAGDLQDAVANTKPESKVSVVVIRKGEKKTIEVKVGSQLPRKHVFVYAPRGKTRNFEVLLGGSRVQGMSLRELNDQLAQYFGVTEGTGALVWEVEKGSAAEKAGVKAGDVITTIGKKKIHTLRDVSRALGIFDDGEKADVEVMRKGARQTLSLEVQDSDSETGFNFWYDGPSFPRHGREFHFDGEPFDITVPEIDMDQVRPHMEEFRMQMDQLRSRMQDESIRLRERIQKDVRNAVRVHVQEII